MMGANILLLVLTFINNKLIYIYIDKESNGLFFLVARFSLFVNLLFGEWLRLSNLNIAGRNKNLSGTLTSNGLWYCLGLGLFLSVVIATFHPFFTRVFGISTNLLFVATGAAVIMVLRDSSQSMLLVNQRIMHFSITHLIMGVLYLGLTFFFLVVCKLGMNAVIIAWVSGIVAAALWALTANISAHGLSPFPSWTIFRESRSIGLRAGVAIIGMFLMTTIHVFVLEPITRGTGEGLVMIAIFSVCYRIFQLFQRFADVTGTLLLSHIVQRDRDTGFRITAISVRNIVLLSLALCMGGILLGKSLILIISDSKYISAYFPLLLMLPGIVAINAGSLINGFYWGHGYPYRIILAPFAATVLGLALDIILIPRWGVSGATFSFSVMGVAWMLYIVNSFSRDSGMRFDEILVPRYSDLVFVVSRLINALRRGKS